MGRAPGASVALSSATAIGAWVVPLALHRLLKQARGADAPSGVPRTGPDRGWGSRPGPPPGLVPGPLSAAPPAGPLQQRTPQATGLAKYEQTAIFRRPPLFSPGFNR